MDWYRNEYDEEALKRGFQGEGNAEAMRGDLTLTELSAKHGLHHTTMASWKHQVIDGIASPFSGAGGAA